MKKYAVLNSNNIVDNVILASSLDVAETVTACTCVFVTAEDDTCNIGKLYSGGVFIDPPAEEIPE
jgi:glycerol-3-phosphate cytidylyltransferase-like family protein